MTKNPTRSNPHFPPPPAYRNDPLAPPDKADEIWFTGRTKPADSGHGTYHETNLGSWHFLPDPQAEADYAEHLARRGKKPLRFGANWQDALVERGWKAWDSPQEMRAAVIRRFDKDTRNGTPFTLADDLRLTNVRAAYPEIQRRPRFSLRNAR